MTLSTTSSISIQEIFPRVANILSDVLDTDEDEIQLNSFLINDLSAESIDFLDIMFRLEREFKVKIPRGQIEKEVRGIMPQAQFEQKGIITSEGLTALQNYLPEIPASAFKPDLKVSEIPTLFTVETLCKLVQKAQQNSVRA